MPKIYTLAFAAFAMLAIAAEIVGLTASPANALNCTSYRVGQYTYTNCD